MSYTAHYDNLAERQQHIDVAEANGYSMLTDDFDANWVKGTEPHGTLTFDILPPPTQEELDRKALEARLLNSEHLQLIQALDNWDSLTADQVKRVVLHLVEYRLWKEGQHP